MSRLTETEELATLRGLVTVVKAGMMVLQGDYPQHIKDSVAPRVLRAIMIAEVTRGTPFLNIDREMEGLNGQEDDNRAEPEEPTSI